MIVNKATLDAITTGFKVVFDGALQGAPQFQDRIATTIPSTSKSQALPMGALLATIREWLGDRVEQNVGAWSKTLTNLKFEGTVGVDRDDIEDDQIGVYEPAIRQLAVAAARYPYEKVIEALDVDGMGSTVLGLDGKPFFSTTHTWPGGYETNQANKTTAALAAAAVKAGITAMRNFKGPDGKALNVRPTVFICSTSLEFTARELFLNERDAAGASNALYKAFSEENIIIEPLLTTAHWMMLDTSKPIKPGIWQSRKTPAFVSMTNPDDEAVFMRGRFRYGVDFRGVAGALAWWLAYGSDGSA